MSNKTQLSTNNAKLDTLTSLTSSMRDKVAALPDAGGGGGSVEIATFSCTCDELQGDLLYDNPFIKGMTWQEFCNSPLNYSRYNGMTAWSYWVSGGRIYALNGGGIQCYVSTDGTESGCVSPTDIIEEITYGHLLKSGGWD